MVNERGEYVHHTTVYCWAQQYAPELDKRCRPHLRSTNDSWRVDETYIKIKGYEIIHMLKKGQVKVEKGAVRERVKFIAEIFGVVA